MIKTPWPLKLIYRQLLWKKHTDEKVLYLTFDDGPVPGPTEFVLNELKQFNAKATFFCVGDNVRKHPEVFRKILAEGHCVGNHTFNHLTGWKTPDQEYFLNIDRCEEEMNRAGKTHLVRLFRPPHGRIRFSQIHNLKEKYTIVMWDILTKDYDVSKPVEACLKRSISAARPGSIVVFHDRYRNEERLRYMLPEFIRHFAGLGFRFDSLDSCVTA